MLSKESFKRTIANHTTWYSSFLLIGTTIEDTLQALNELTEAGIIKEENVGMGEEGEDGIRFEILNSRPTLIYDITAKLGCRGYADTDRCNVSIAAAEKGEPFNNYKAEWQYGCPFNISDDTFSCFFDITDPTGTVFHTGGGCVNSSSFAYYKKIVDKH